MALPFLGPISYSNLYQKQELYYSPRQVISIIYLGLLLFLENNLLIGLGNLEILSYNP